MKYIRRWLYRRGYRPKPSSVWYSLSLAMLYSMQGIDWDDVLRNIEKKDG